MNKSVFIYSDNGDLIDTNDIENIHKQTNLEKSSVTWDDLIESINTFETLPNEYKGNQLKTDVNIEDKITFDIKEDTSKCKACNQILLMKDNIFICKTCGREYECNSNIEMETHVSNPNDFNSKDSHMPISINGSHIKGNQKSLYKTSANHDKHRQNTINKELKQLNTQSKNIILPIYIINEAADLFSQIKSTDSIFRLKSKRGVQGAIIKKLCIKYKVSRTPQEICEIMDVPEKYFSNGERILEGLIENKVIQLDFNVNPIECYVDRYFEVLELQNKHKAFIYDLIDRAEKKNIHMVYDTKDNTKVVGAIYMLINRVSEYRTITKDTIEKKCGVTKTTFNMYYQVLYQYYNLIRKVFKKHGIKMPNEWIDKSGQLGVPTQKRRAYAKRKPKTDETDTN